MHHRGLHGFESYVPVGGFTDIARVFLSPDDVELWTLIAEGAPSPHQVFTYAQTLLTKQNRLHEAAQAAILLELATDGPDLASKLRLLFSDGATITAVIAQWRSLASILTSLQTTLSQGMPLTSLAAEAEALVGGNWESKCIDLTNLATWC